MVLAVVLHWDCVVCLVSLITGNKQNENQEHQNQISLCSQMRYQKGVPKLRSQLVWHQKVIPLERRYLSESPHSPWTLCNFYFCFINYFVVVILIDIALYCILKGSDKSRHQIQKIQAHTICVTGPGCFLPLLYLTFIAWGDVLSWY